jgi:putative redox protein
MQFQKLTFRNAAGQRLDARLDLPMDEKPHAYAIFAHCFTCTKNFNAVVNISRALTRDKIAVLRFDFTGLGESEGDFSNTGFSSNVSDLVAAAEFLKSGFDAPKLLIGHSLGGAAVLQAAASIPSSLAVATIGAPADLSSVARFLSREGPEIRSKGEARVTLAGRSFRIRKEFVDELDRSSMEQSIRQLGKALLIFHSPRDTIVGIESAGKIFRAARHPKSFISLDQADHLLSSRSDSLYAGAVLAAWAGKYIGSPEDRDREERDLTDNRIVVHTGQTGYRTEILAGAHRLIADEPFAVGGSGTGPSPYDYLVSALGACTSMTLRMYADRKEWPLESIVVRLKHRKVHARDCSECESKSGRIDVVEREIELRGPLDAEQRERLLEIADRCPVHRTLHSEVRVETRLKA